MINQKSILIEKKRIFKEIEKPTFDFLKKDSKHIYQFFFVDKNNIENNNKLNRNNAISFLGTVYCYCQLIKEFDENVKYNNQAAMLENSEANKNMEVLKSDIKFILSKINKKNYLDEDIHSSINNTVKHGNNYDETIRRLANVIINKVNNYYKLINSLSININNISS